MLQFVLVALLAVPGAPLVAPPAGVVRVRVVRAQEQEEVMRAEDPLVQRVAAEVAEATGGASLDVLLNPAKLLNVERELVELRAKRDALSTRDEALEAQIAAKEAVAYVEKRAVMKDWLKWIFRGQAYATVVVSLAAVYDAFPGLSLDLSVRVLGFWSWWLFTVPSLRSIKPLPPKDKKALDAAFLATLVVSLAAPFATKDPPTIWWVDAATVGLCYAYGYLAPETTKGDDDDAFDAKAAGGAGAFGQSLWRAARFAAKALDFGSGAERGARQQQKTQFEVALDDFISAGASSSAVRKDDGADDDDVLSVVSDDGLSAGVTTTDDSSYSASSDSRTSSNSSSSADSSSS
eukprot:CAMPEP_0198647664 /NCGR_PEP_ID=MMETSP1467-20131203/2895_1 /TAXON_ID=1462469 /ORGANISM="unid. sp., Strain CCMP2135" /LENGTH=348 /DNA_ID=CAMNT_0044383319 /DNA_START=21 /DNA_END=1067 /DNA_ORIENTATION=-